MTARAAIDRRERWSAEALGRDLAFTTDVVTSANGDWMDVVGEECLVADLLHRLETPLGSYVIDPEYGSNVDEWLHATMDAVAQVALAVEIQSCLERDPRIDSATVTVALVDTVVTARVLLDVAERSNPLNLVFGWDLARPGDVAVTRG